MLSEVCFWFLDVRRVGDDIFGDVRQQALENSLSDDEDGLFVAKSGRFTKGGGLFDDVENDEVMICYLKLYSKASSEDHLIRGHLTLGDISLWRIF